MVQNRLNFKYSNLSSTKGPLNSKIQDWVSKLREDAINDSTYKQALPSFPLPIYVNVNKSNLLWCIVLCAWNRSMYVNCTRPELWTKSPKLLRISAIWWDQLDRCHKQTLKQYCKTCKKKTFSFLSFDIFFFTFQIELLELLAREKMR